MTTAIKAEIAKKFRTFFWGGIFLSLLSSAIGVAGYYIGHYTINHDWDGAKFWGIVLFLISAGNFAAWILAFFQYRHLDKDNVQQSDGANAALDAPRSSS